MRIQFTLFATPATRRRAMFSKVTAVVTFLAVGVALFLLAGLVWPPTENKSAIQAFYNIPGGRVGQGVANLVCRPEFVSYGPFKMVREKGGLAIGFYRRWILLREVE